MNISNKLTVLRMILVPFFLAFLLFDFPFHNVAALVVFIVAAITDSLDGKIARKRGLVTDFGKFLDPIADKMLTTAAFLGFIVLDMGYGTVWVTLIIILREFLVASIRMIAAGKGIVIAADIWGKVKTVFQMVSIILILMMTVLVDFLPLFGIIDTQPVCSVFNIIYTVLLWICAVLTVVSGINYIIKNRSVLGKGK